MVTEKNFSNMTQKLSLQDVLAPNRIIEGANVQSKKKAFELIANTFAYAKDQLNAHEIFDALVARERLGNTAINHGVAIPHCRVVKVEQPMGCLIHLNHPIDYGATDRQDVDLLFALVVPEDTDEQHLELLATIAEYFHQDENRKALKQAKSKDELYQTLIRQK